MAASVHGPDRSGQPRGGHPTRRAVAACLAWHQRPNYFDL